ncbi:MAG: UDP-3-O-acyl-N-acetylglucosamine deacetylase [Desulfohalobiaceae bacterium]|nr:UDP-3-O-acyl-N-acetylglucosamine deacetylase [Desulfohalobiaceae bacterium]
MRQRTIGKAVSCSGVGLHRGGKVTMTIYPAPENTGIVFVLKTGQGRRFIQADPYKVHETTLATCLGDGECSIGTVEHVLAALMGTGVDNIHIEVDSNEIPIMDGSAASFVYLLQQAGYVRQQAKKRVYRLKQPVEFSSDGKRVVATPGTGLKVSYTIEYDHPLIGRQEFSFSLQDQSFVEDLCKARTFAFLNDVEVMRANGLALGGSLDNALVLDGSGVVNTDGLRYADEPVRHKILDFIGDLGLMPFPVTGHFHVYCSGHAMNNKFCRYLLAHERKYLECCEVAERVQEKREAAIVPQAAGESFL